MIGVSKHAAARCEGTLGSGNGSEQKMQRGQQGVRSVCQPAPEASLLALPLATRGAEFNVQQAFSRSGEARVTRGRGAG